jgi:RNA polymerase sigma factor (sigma-70 family)
MRPTMVEGDAPRPDPDGSAVPGTATMRLLVRARAGDGDALNALFERFGPELRRFARGRLPRQVRGLVDTPDVVQETLLQTFTHLNGFDNRGEGALRAYMRQVLVNRIRDEIRRAARRPAGAAIDDEHPSEDVSPLEAAIGREGVERYEAALARLRPEEREMVIARVELGLSYPEIAVSAGRSSANAARMAVVRALVRLSEAMDVDDAPGRA